MSDLLRSLPSIRETPSRPGPNALSSHPGRRTSDAADFDPDTSSSSDSSTSTAESITTLRPASPPPTTLSASPPHPSIPWTRFFSQELRLPHHDAERGARAEHHAYLTPPADPKKGPLYICLHGAGSSAMSFAPFAGALRSLCPEAGILSLSTREHGSSVSSVSSRGATTPASASSDTAVADDVPLLDFSLATLTGDALRTIELVRTRMGWDALPPAVLVGHSLGGAVATAIAASAASSSSKPGETPLGSALVGTLVLDVVEGSAVEALGFMRTYLAGRPRRFADVDEAVEWHVRSRVVRDRGSAEVTVPSLLKRLESDEGGWGWRTDLARTQEWWEGWFEGMSKRFLAGRAAKGLVLAGTDRLDKELMVGQMQGKFQLTVIPEAGHFIQEDVPERLAGLAVDFFRRNDRSALVLPPKVADLIAQGKKV